MKTVATDLKVIYAASTEAEAEFNLELKAREMGYALPEQKPRRGGPDFPRVIPLFAISEGIRRIIYTTNATRPVNMTLRKVTRHHRIFPSDEAVYKVVYLAMRYLAKKWTMPIRDWKPAPGRFAREFAERFPR